MAQLGTETMLRSDRWKEKERGTGESHPKVTGLKNTKF